MLSQILLNEIEDCLLSFCGRSHISAHQNTVFLGTIHMYTVMSSCPRLVALVFCKFKFTRADAKVSVRLLRLWLQG